MSVIYRRFGGSTHVRIESFAQLKEAVQIPETQWVATSAPTTSFVADPKFLALLDDDHNGRVRVEEVRRAVAFTAEMLADGRGVDEASDTLVLAHLSSAGAALKGAAELILEALSVEDRTRVTLARIREAQAPLRTAGKNGDGILADVHVSEALRPLAARIRALYPETKNRAGVAGLAPETLQTFRRDRERLLAHEKTRAAVEGALLLPDDEAGDGDLALRRARRILAVQDVLDEHFLLCRLVASQPDARERFRLAAERITALVGDRAAMEKALQALPIAPPDPAGVLAWGTLLRGPRFETLQSFAVEIAAPLTKDKEQLTEGTWRDLVARAVAVVAWRAAHDDNPASRFDGDLSAVTPDELDALQKEQQADLDRRPLLDAVDALEKLVLFQRWLLPFCNSFLAMPDLYGRKRALFERGHAVLAGRRYEKSLLVPDEGAHRAHTEQGTTCVIYARIQDKDGSAQYLVALPKTRGWSTEIAVGKRGIFYDVAGNEFDAVVTHVVRHPVSVYEAALSPFLRLGQFLNKKLESLGSGVDAALERQTAVLDGKIDATKAGLAQAAARASTTEPRSANSPPPAPAAGAGNALAMGGLAVAAVGSSVAFITAQLKALSLFDVLSIIAALFFATAVPSGFVGWLKLRRRNLAQLLEGSGWALNDQLRMTPALASRITKKPPRVPGSSLEVIPLLPDADDEPEQGVAWGWKLAAALVVVGFVGWKLKDPLLRVGCHEHKVPEAVCVGLGVSDGPAPRGTGP